MKNKSICFVLRSVCIIFVPTTNNKREMERTVFNKAQIELLDLMAGVNSEEELNALKYVISEFFARCADEELDKLWQNGQWNEQTLEDLHNAHYRTPYKQ